MTGSMSMTDTMASPVDGTMPITSTDMMAGMGDMAVIGVPDERWGEVGCAYVVPAAGASLTEQQVIEHCGRYLAKYKIPKQVVITDRIERTASGKSQKHLLLERWRAQFSTARA